eukprot:ANDGO_08638.mRNA.1 Cell division cycle protein 123 homolog
METQVDASEVSPIDNLDVFAVQSWYGQFADVTISTAFFECEDSFVAYLEEDAAVVDNRLFHESTKNNAVEDAPYRNTLRAIEGLLDQFGGKAFLKCLFSAPKDATWVMPTHSLQCTSLTDVLLLLKSSYAVSFDLIETEKFCDGLFSHINRNLFAVRKFDSRLATATEFRVFVRDNVVLGVSQRHCDERYDVLQDPAFRSNVLDAIDRFFEERVRDRFPASSFAMDISYRPQSNQVVLVDFSPFHPITNPLLFSWDRLETAPLRGRGVLSHSSQTIDFRFIGPNDAPMNMSATFFAGVPADLTTLSNNAEDAIRRLADEYKRMDEELSEGRTSKSSTRNDSDEECES